MYFSKSNFINKNSNKRCIQLLAMAQTGKKLESWAMDTFCK
jgi:hypothetical protein